MFTIKSEHFSEVVESSVHEQKLSFYHCCVWSLVDPPTGTYLSRYVCYCLQHYILTKLQISYKIIVVQSSPTINLHRRADISTTWTSSIVVSTTWTFWCIPWIKSEARTTTWSCRSRLCRYPACPWTPAGYIIGGQTWTLTKKKKNKRQHSLNGNIKNYYKNFSDIIFQNIPGRRSPADLQIALDILFSQDPTVLAIGETEHASLEDCHHPGYDLIKGRITNPINNKIRINLFIKTGTQYEEIDMACEVPTVAVKYGDWSLVFLYREWAKQADQSTRSLPLQLERWTTMVSKWKTLQGKCLLMGKSFSSKYFG